MCVNENLVRMNICDLVSERFPLKMLPLVEGLPNGVKFFLSYSLSHESND